MIFLFLWNIEDILKNDSVVFVNERHLVQCCLDPIAFTLKLIYLADVILPQTFFVCVFFVIKLQNDTITIIVAFIISALYSIVCRGDDV